MNIFDHTRMEGDQSPFFYQLQIPTDSLDTEESQSWVAQFLAPDDTQEAAQIQAAQKVDTVQAPALAAQIQAAQEVDMAQEPFESLVDLLNSTVILDNIFSLPPLQMVLEQESRNSSATDKLSDKALHQTRDIKKPFQIKIIDETGNFYK